MKLMKEINDGVVGVQHLIEQAGELVAWFDEEHASKFSIIEASGEGSIEWDPEAGKEFKGKGGITTDTGVAKRRGVGKKDLVVKMADGRPVGVGVVVGIDRNGVHVGNPKNPEMFKGPMQTRDFTPADRENKVIQQLMSKNPGRNVWVVEVKSRPLGMAPN